MSCQASFPRHQGLMDGEIIRCLGRPMRLDAARARGELSVDRADASRDQVGVRKVADPYRTVVTLRDEINEAIAVAGMDMKLGVTTRHLREHGREVGRAERERRSNPQAADNGPGRVSPAAASASRIESGLSSFFWPEGRT
jgi:hypothetical protein